jgi:D-alanyl-D-alanine carboxypeptidase/D-alanyl-D-alanine-endopeptidase (penicillin-binding protein 4)
LNRREVIAAIAAWGLAIALGGCGGAAAVPAGDEATLHPVTTARAVTTPAATAAGAPARPRQTRARRVDRRSPALRHLQAVLVSVLRQAGPHTGALVLDLSSGRSLFTHETSVARPPASVEKLYTSVALIDLLGNDTRLPTEVLATGHLAGGGVWRGNLFLRGGGDPTFGDGWFNQAYEGGRGPTAAALVAQLRRVGIRRVAGHLFADESRFDADRGGPLTGYAPDTPDYGGQMSALVFDHGATAAHLSPAAFAARQLARTMRRDHLFALAARRTAVTPRGARLLAAVHSPPLPVLLRLMDVPSDDLFADLLTKQLGYRSTGFGTLAAGAAQIGRVIAGTYHQPARILDGSGLDKADRTTPAQVVGLLHTIWRTPVGRELRAALPTVGQTGTVRFIGAQTAANGRCQAKTGTLDDVTNLAGYCTARGGHTLAFALMLDGPENWRAYEMLGRMVGALAAY